MNAMQCLANALLLVLSSWHSFSYGSNPHKLPPDATLEISPPGKRQGNRHLLLLYSASNVGFFIRLGPAQDKASRGWGYGFVLALCVVAVFSFLCGTAKYRQQLSSIRFLARSTQLGPAAGSRKRFLSLPEIGRTKSLRMLARRLFSRKTRRMHINQGDSAASDKWTKRTKRSFMCHRFGSLGPEYVLVISQILAWAPARGRDDIGIIVNAVCSLAVVCWLCAPFFLPLARKLSVSPTAKRTGVATIIAVLMASSATLVERRRRGFQDMKERRLRRLRIGFCAVHEILIEFARVLGADGAPFLRGCAPKFLYRG